LGAGDFVRAGTMATRVNPTTWLVEAVGAGVARIEAPGTPKVWSLLLEPASTNLFIKSRDFNDAAWVKLAGDSINNNGAVGVDGTSVADGYIGDAGNEVHMVYQSVQQADIADNIPFCGSLYAKTGTHSWLQLQLRTQDNTQTDLFFDLGSGIKGVQSLIAAPDAAGIEAIGNDWYRCWICDADSGSITVSAVLFARPSDSDGDNVTTGDGASVMIWIDGAQMEELPYPSSLVITDAAAVARTSEDPADTNGLTYNIPTALFSGAGKGTAVVWFWSPYGKGVWATTVASRTPIFNTHAGDSGQLYIDTTGVITSNDQTTAVTTATSMVTGWNMAAVKWNYDSGGAKFKVGLDNGTGFSWGVQGAYDGAFSETAGKIEFGRTMDVPIRVVDLMIWKTFISESDIRDLGGPQ